MSAGEDGERQRLDSSSEHSIRRKQIGRRRFLKSVFGLGTVLDLPEAQAAHHSSRSTFIWADLKTGQVGFPTGLDLGTGLPGSLMKIVAAAALEEEGLISPNHIIECPGHVTIHKETFHCQKAHGRVNLVRAIARSCNVYFIEASKKLPGKIFIAYAAKFGLDQGVAGRNSGPFPSRLRHDTYEYVLGLAPDFMPGALQILRMAALVGTRGNLPYLHSAEAPDPDHPPFTLQLKDATWSKLQEGMQLACREGTARALDPENAMHIAAKTGTAQVGERFQSWITGYFPYDNPKHAFVLHAPAGTSQDAAVPKVHEFLFATQWP